MIATRDMIEENMSDESSADCVNDHTFVMIQRFLNRESALLDRGEYLNWYKLAADDMQYVVTAQVARESQLGKLHYAIIDDNAADLKARVDQISNPKLTHAENPPTLTRRFISGVEAWNGKSEAEFIVNSSILVYHARPDEPGGVYSGARRDLLRKVGGSLQISRREVSLDHVLLRGPVSTLF
jgi:3-phenylpropionate/cinnamic acid dioxygenase small subunit